MERFVKDPHTLRQKRQGPLCPHIDEFAQHRKGLVVAPVTLVERTTIDKLLDDFSLYLQQERVLAPTTVANYVSLINKMLMINGDFRVFNDMVDRWCQKYSHASGARPVVESVVREWFEQQLVETIMGALTLRGSSQWTIQDLERLWGEEALTAAVLPRYHIDMNVKRTLGSKIGSLKEQVA